MTENEEEMVFNDLAEFDQHIARSCEIVADVMHKAMGELEKQDVSAGVVISFLIRQAAYTSRDLDAGKSFLRIAGESARIAMGKEDAGDDADTDTDTDTDTGQPSLNDRSKFLVEGMKVTARLNAGAHGVSAAALVPLLIHAACELAREEDRLEEFIEIISKMAELASSVIFRGRQTTKH